MSHNDRNSGQRAAGQIAENSSPDFPPSCEPRTEENDARAGTRTPCCVITFRRDHVPELAKDNPQRSAAETCPKQPRLEAASVGGDAPRNRANTQNQAKMVPARTRPAQPNADFSSAETGVLGRILIVCALKQNYPRLSTYSSRPAAKRRQKRSRQTGRGHSCFASAT